MFKAVKLSHAVSEVDETTCSESLQGQPTANNHTKMQLILHVPQSVATHETGLVVAPCFKYSCSHYL